MVTVWSTKAKLQLQQGFDFIKQDSLQNAEKVRDEIIDATIDILHHPEKYPPDKYKTTNDGSYRVFEIHHYRIFIQSNKRFYKNCQDETYQQVSIELLTVAAEYQP